MKSKIPETDWSKFETIPFAVVFWSGALGWITMSNPQTPADAHRSFEACDSNEKMLLNYGSIIAEVKP